MSGTVASYQRVCDGLLDGAMSDRDAISGESGHRPFEWKRELRRRGWTRRTWCELLLGVGKRTDTCSMESYRQAEREHQSRLIAETMNHLDWLLHAAEQRLAREGVA